MTIERTIGGGYIISEVKFGVLIHRHYIGYTKREAIKAFKEYLKSLEN